MNKIITAKEYAEKIGYSAASITKRLKSQNENYSLPYAVSIKKFGNTWVIEIDTPFPSAKAKKMFKENLVNSN